MPKTLIAFDIDHTTIPWRPIHLHAYDKEVFTKTTQFLISPEVRKRSFFMLTTGRGAGAVSEIRHIVGQLPLDALSLDNGKRIYRRPEETPVPTWLDSLVTLEHDSKWGDKLTRKYNWDPDGACVLLREALEKEGFNDHSLEDPDPHGRIVFRRPCAWRKDSYPVWLKAFVAKDETGVAFKLSYRGDHDRLEGEVAPILKGITRRFNDQDIDLTITPESRPGGDNQVFVIFSPKEISKAAALSHIVHHWDLDVHSTITAGDGRNDIELLSRVSYGLAPNHPIVVGGDPVLRRAVETSGTPGAIFVEDTELPEALTQQWHRINAQR